MSTQAKTPAAKPAAPAQKKSGGIPAGVVMIILFIIAYLFFTFVMGDGSRFEGGTNEGHPHPGDYLAIAFKGGSIVPILMTCFLKCIMMHARIQNNMQYFAHNPRSFTHEHCATS